MTEQRTDAWWQERCGKVTASRIADVIARTKSGWGASRANYMAQLVAERLTGTVQESYTNAAMQWGIDKEDEAISTYAFMQDAEVEPVGFVPHPKIDNTGASPDGLVNDDGLVEVKCPQTAQHIETLLGQSIADKYIVQMQWQMECTDRKWADFVSYDPRMPARLALFVQRIGRDEVRLKQIREDVIVFLGELDEKVKKLEAA